MTTYDRIAQIEHDLAVFQTNAIPGQIEAALVRERLKETLSIAMRIIGHAADDFDHVHDGLTDGFM